MSNLVLECKNLHKNFGKKQILKDVSLNVYSGDILGFIGPNGAGKTTTIKLILGLQSITSGEIEINGVNIKNNFEKAINKVGAIVENPDMYMYMSGYDNLKLVSNLYPNITKERIDEVVKLVKLENRINDKVNKYSLGMRQRLGVAQAILHKPNLLILDEPTNGLDPEGIKELRLLLKDLAKKENMAVLISSHNLAELETFCNKISIIQNGIVIETTTVKELKNVASGERVVFEINDTTNVKTLLENADIVDEDTFTMNLNRDEIPGVVKILIENNILVYGILEEKLTLEDAFLKKTGGNKID